MTKQVSKQTETAINAITSTFNKVQDDTKDVADKMAALNSTDVSQVGQEARSVIMNTHNTIRHLRGETTSGEKVLATMSSLPIIGKMLPAQYRMMNDSAVAKMTTNQVVDACMDQIEEKRAMAAAYCDGTQQMLDQNRKGIEELSKAVEVIKELNISELDANQAAMVMDVQGTLEMLRTNELDMNQILALGTQVHTQIRQMQTSVRNDLTTAILKHETINKINEMAQSMVIAQDSVNALNKDLNKRMSTAMDSSIKIMENLLEKRNIQLENQEASRQAALENQKKLNDFTERARAEAKKAQDDILNDAGDIFEGEIVRDDTPEPAKVEGSLDDVLSSLKSAKENQEVPVEK